MNRTALTVLLAALVLGACAGRQEKIEAQNRRPLRDIFPPPSVETAGGAGTQETAQAPQPPAAVEPAPGAGGADVAAAPPPPSVEPSVSDGPAPGSPGDEEAGRPLFKDEGNAQVEEALGVGGSSLADEFGLKRDPSEGAPPPAAGGMDIEPQPAERPAEEPAPATSQAEAAPPSQPAPAAEPMPSAPTATTSAPTTPAPATPAPTTSAPTTPAPATTAQADTAQAGAAAATAKPPQGSAAKSAEGPKRAPRILFSNRPALLVPVYGAPRLKPVEGSPLQRVENSPAIVLKGKSGNYYIPVYDGFVQSKRLSGPWTVTKSPPPKVLLAAKAKLLESGQQDLFAAKPDSATGRTPSLALGAPSMIISDQPTALIVVDGQAGYQKVRNTQFSRLINTQSRVFRSDADKTLYVQIGEDWFSAASTKGPWKHVPAAELPADLLKVGR